LVIKIKKLGVIKKIRDFREGRRRQRQIKKIEYENKQWDKKLRGLK